MPGSHRFDHKGAENVTSQKLWRVPYELSYDVVQTQPSAKVQNPTKDIMPRHLVQALAIAAASGLFGLAGASVAATATPPFQK